MTGAERSRKWRRDHPGYYTMYLKRYGPKWRVKLKQKGLCVRCGKRKVLKWTTCSECKEYHKTVSPTIRAIRKEDRPLALRRSKKAKRCCCCGSRTHNGRGWHIDHDHKTKKFRGILCNNCNLGLGHFKDSVQRLSQAIKYLEIMS